MADLDQFPSDVYQTLIALPYRVGLFVSQSDRTGGEAADAREIAALENVVTFYVEDTLKSEFAQDIMLATLQNKAHWTEWGQGIGAVPEECRDMIGYLTDRIDSRSLTAFKNNLFEIAMAVAMAYQEGPASDGAGGFFKSFFGGPKKQPALAAGVTHYHNISRAEREALDALAGILDLTAGSIRS